MKYGNTWSLFPYFLFEIVSKKRFQCKYILFKNGQKRSRNDVKKGEEKRGKGAGRGKNGGRSEGRVRYKVVIINRDKNK